jgi:hypothetical protein
MPIRKLFKYVENLTSQSCLGLISATIFASPLVISIDNGQNYTQALLILLAKLSEKYHSVTLMVRLSNGKIYFDRDL